MKWIRSLRHGGDADETELNHEYVESGEMEDRILGL